MGFEDPGGGGAGGGGGGGGVAAQEAVATEVITGADTALAATLTATPSPAPALGLAPSLRLYLNGILQVQGAAADYTIAVATITWLADTGTAVDLDLSDVLTAVYES